MTNKAVGVAFLRIAIVLFLSPYAITAWYLSGPNSPGFSPASFAMLCRTSLGTSLGYSQVFSRLPALAT